MQKNKPVTIFPINPIFSVVSRLINTPSPPTITTEELCLGTLMKTCLLYTSDAADDYLEV